MQGFRHLLFLMVSGVPLLIGLPATTPAWAQPEDLNMLYRDYSKHFKNKNYTEALIIAERMLEIAEKQYGKSHATTATALHNLAVVHQEQNHFTEAEKFYHQALETYKRALGGDHFDMVVTLSNLAILHQIQADYSQVGTLLLRVIAIKEKTLGPQHAEVDKSRDELARFYRLHRKGREAEAESQLKRILAIREKVHGVDADSVVESLNELVDLYQSQSRYNDTESLLKRIIAIREKKLGRQHPHLATNLRELALFYKAHLSGRGAEIEQLLKRTLAIREKALSQGHEEILESLKDLADLFEEQERYAEKEPLLAQILAMQEKVLGPEHPEVAAGVKNLASLYQSQQRYADAEALLNRALAIHEKVHGREHEKVVAALKDLVDLYRWDVESSAKAEPFLKRILFIREKVHGPEHSEVLESLKDLADLYGSQQRYAEAETMLMRRIAVRKKTFGQQHDEVLEAEKDLADLYGSQQRHSEAEALLKRALAIYEKVHGSDHEKTLGGLKNLADLYRFDFDSERSRHAEPFLARILRIRERVRGPEHDEVLASLKDLADLYGSQQRYSEAEALLKRRIAIREKTLGSEHSEVLKAQKDLADAFKGQKRFPEADALLKLRITILERTLGPDHPDVLNGLKDLATLYWDQGESVIVQLLSESLPQASQQADHQDFAESFDYVVGTHFLGQSLASVRQRLERATSYCENASLPKQVGERTNCKLLSHLIAEGESLLKRILKMQEAMSGYKQDDDLVRSLKDLAYFYSVQGHFTQTEVLLKRVNAIYEDTLGASHSKTVNSLTDLADLYESQKRYRDAGDLLEKQLAIRETILGVEHADTLNALTRLAKFYKLQMRYLKAEVLLKRRLAARGKIADKPDFETLKELVDVYKAQKRYVEAETLLKRYVVMNEKEAPTLPQNATYSLNWMATMYGFKELADICASQERYVETESWLRRSLSLLRTVRDPSAQVLIPYALLNLATHLETRGQINDAIKHMEEAAKLLVAHPHRLEGPRGFFGVVARQIIRMEKRNPYLALVSNAWFLAAKTREKVSGLVDGAFQVAQADAQSTTAIALARMAARFGTSNTKLGSLVRELTDLTRKSETLANREMTSQFRPLTRGNESENEQGRLATWVIRQRIDDLTELLRKDYPTFGELTNPRPWSLQQVQGAIASNEALVMFFVRSSEETYVWALTRDHLSWKRIELGAKSLGDKVSTLRAGLDCRVAKQAGCLPWQLAFDLDLAHELYKMLLDPVRDLIKGKQHLIVVPSGPLTSLPFHLLVTEKQAASQPEHYAGYRDPDWLIKRHTVTVLPSVTSLKALQVLAAAGQAEEAFVGFGDPNFSVPGISLQQRSQRAVSTRAFGSYFKGRLADRDALARLDPLPETAVELTSIARTLGVPASNIYLKERASETLVKQLSLERYRIVYFATHGLIAGDVRGLAEPALVLSAPTEPNDLDDGLLTASEAAQLKLNADWVILSACSTAAGETPGAEALSGLARAFFYAGARALLVSHWPVESEAAVKLTVRAFSELKAAPGIGRAEALRRSMLALMSDRDIRYAHPALWGPFMVVGEGGVEHSRTR